ncbi:light-regulated protein [Quillaja saponaria]|uniref:Light-regulated protein n=1 Tax=Quillaja saponaria TaxID=32244 RepID=A0AAD7Q7I9_QUISA|nr:light-regulated protein [Quillaja saponaria]KAJ7976289.1 light-regulated protein [Quillaja saponaria]
MQAALTFAPNLLPLTPSKNLSISSRIPPNLSNTVAPRHSPIKASSVTCDTSTVDYNSLRSVFPAEACETIGGEACLADI